MPQTNTDRAEHARQTVEFYDATTQGPAESPDNITDLLTDLRHYCHREKFNFDELIQSSDMHFDAELDEGFENEEEA